MKNLNKNAGLITGGFVIGALIGASVGVLFAPHKGKKTRKLIATAVKKTVENFAPITVEKVEDIEEYYPDRMASRILGMGDVLSLIEKAKENFDEAAARNTMDRIKKNTFDLNDMLDQFEQIKKMGSMKDVLGMLPGVGGKIKDQDIDDRIIDVNMAIIRSMTKKERRIPNILNASRRKRIAAGSGTTVQQVNTLMKQYEQSTAMMKQFANMNKGKAKGRFRR